MTGHLHDEAPFEEVSREHLLHVLTCPRCRSWVIGKLLDRCAAPDEDETLVEYEPVFASLLEKNPGILDAARASRGDAEHLLAELLALPAGKKRTRAVRAARFQNVALLDLLLESSHASQISDPSSAADLGLLAYRLGECLGPEEEDAYAAIPRALSLAANARRLQAALRSADHLLAQGAGFLRDRIDRAFHCRVAGLVRWEAGRTDEGSALLDRALLYYAAEDLVEEQGCTLALIGLLEEEDGQNALALPNLLKGWTLMDRQTRPGFAVRVGLNLALCLADVDQGERARSLLREVWKLSSHVTDASEWLRLYWTEARVLGRLGEAAEAMEMLSSVRSQLEAEGSEAEADLVGLDFDLLLAEAGRLDETEFLKPLLPQDFAIAPDERWRDVTALAQAGLRRAFRLEGHLMKPLPFA